MFGRSRLHGLLLVGLAGGFFALAYLLMQFRFSSGDVYPPYSSLRSDPLGAKGLYQSLEGLPNLDVQRNFSRWSKLSKEPATVLILGLHPSESFPHLSETLKSLDPLLAQGSRVVLGFTPKGNEAFFEEYLREPEADDENEAEEEPAPSLGPQPLPPDDEVEEFLAEMKGSQRMGYALDTFDWDFHEEDDYPVATLAGRFPTPTALTWHSIYHFKDLEPEWQVVYELDEMPVVIERQVGAGSLVVFTDCYHLSNQALWEAAEPRFLSWLIGPHHTIVFEETHFGIKAETNVMGLIRQFRLEGVLLGGILLALLYIWQQTSSLVPPLDRATSENHQPQNVAVGLVNLLSRGLERTQLLSTCVQAWRATLKSHQKHLQNREADVISALAQQSKNPKSKESVVSQYNMLQKIVTRRNPSS